MVTKAPEAQPLIDIPGIDDAESIELVTKGRGDALVFRIFSEGGQIKLDGGTNWLGTDWFGLVIRELDRRDWKYRVEKRDKTNVFIYLRGYENHIPQETLKEIQNG